MSKRSNKKLLVGLGSLIGITATSVIGSLGIKALIDRKNALDFAKEFDQNRAIQSVDNLPNYNVATKDMFIDTQYLNFHMGHPGIGQTITPYGWLGTYTKQKSGYWDNTLALTSWNGEVLWVNNENRIKIYDAKYESKHGAIFVIRTNDKSGTSGLTLTIHDVRNGKMVYEGPIASVRADGDISDYSVSRQWYSGFQDFIATDNSQVIFSYQFDINKWLGNPASGGTLDQEWFYNNLSRFIKLKGFEFSHNNDGTISRVEETFNRESLPSFSRPGNQDYYIMTNPVMFNFNDRKDLIYFKLYVEGHKNNWGKRYHSSIKYNISTNKIEFHKEWYIDGGWKKGHITVERNHEKHRLFTNNLYKFNSRPTRNIFNKNLVTIPYFAGAADQGSTPVQNVLQLYAPNQDSTGFEFERNDTSLKSYSFDFGSDIYRYWGSAIDQPNLSPEQIVQQKKLDIYPFEKPGNSGMTVVNALKTVSPFDQTILFTARPPFAIVENNVDIFGYQNKYRDRFSSFWLSRGKGYKGYGTKYRNFIIPNNTSLNSTLLSGIGGNDVHYFDDNFTFDINSYNQDFDNISLYFNGNSNRKDNEGSSNFPTNRIGKVVINRSNYMYGNITSIGDIYGSTVEEKKWQNIYPINDNNQYQYVYSMADLTKWYPRTWYNLNNPANGFYAQGNPWKNINEDKPLVVNQVNSSLGDQYNNNQAVKLVTNYLDNNSFRQNSLISVESLSNQGSVLGNDLILKVQNYLPSSSKIYPEWSEFNTGIIKFQRIYNIPINSEQILTSLNNQYKIKNISNLSSNNLNIVGDYTSNPTVSTIGPLTFARENNDHQKLLRLELAIDFNPNNYSNREFDFWVNSLVPSKYKQSYPIEPGVNELSFNKVMQEYINWKAQNLFWNQAVGDSSGGVGTLGLNNLTIKAYLKLNPNKFDNNTIYKINENKYVGVKTVNGNPKLFIYNDQYVGNRYIYSMQANKFEHNQLWGFTDSFNSLYFNGVKPNVGTKFYINFKPNLQQNNLVRNGATLNQSIDYIENNTKLRLTFKDQYLQWIKSRFYNYNQMLGLSLRFEYKDYGSDQWKTLEQISWDQNMVTRFTNNTLEFNSPSQNIEKIRFRLVKINKNDINNYIDTDVYTDDILNSMKYISDEMLLSTIRIIVDNNWISNLDFATITNITYSNEVNLSKIQMFENEVLKNINNSNLRNKVKLVYKFNNKENLSQNELISEINKLKEYTNSETWGILQFWNGNQGYKIEAKFAKVDPNDISYDIFATTNQQIENVLVNTTNLKSQIDLREFVINLKNKKTNLNAGSTPDNVTGFTPPKMPGEIGNGFLYGRTFDEIQTHLKKFGIEFEFSSDNGVNWVSKLFVSTYDPTIGAYKMRVKPLNDKVVLSLENNNDINNTNFNNINILLKLNVPKTLIINQQFINEFINTQNVISGNTKNLTILLDAEQQLIRKIKDENIIKNPDFSNANLSILYSLGNSGWLSRSALTSYLSNQNEDQSTNEIKFKLNITNTDPQNPEFSLEREEEYVLHQKTLTNDAKVKIYVHAKNYETLANGISIRGTNDSFTWEGLNNWVNESNFVIGSNNGLRIQYTINKNLTTQHYQPGTDPVNGWSDNKVNYVDPAAKYLAIQVVAVPGYVYQADLESQWNIHLVRTNEIKGKLPVRLNQLKEIIWEGFSNGINLNNLELLEKKVIADQIADPESRWKLEVEYNISTIMNEGVWITRKDINNKLQEYATDFNNNTLSILKFSANENDNFVKVKARFVSKDPLLTPSDPTVDPEIAQNGVLLNTSKVITKINLSEYVNVLKTTEVVFADGSQTNNILGITIPPMNGQAGQGFLKGKTFKEIEAALKLVGIKVQFVSPKKKDEVPEENEWKDLSEIRSLNERNELFVRFKIENSDQNWQDSYSISVEGNENDNNPPKAIKLVTNLPITIVVNPSEDLKGLELLGNTKNITNIDAIKAKEKEIIDRVLAKNSSNSTDVTDAPLKIQYSLAEKDLDGTNTIWYSIDDLKAKLVASTNDWNTNNIKARFVMGTNNPKKYNVSDSTPIDIMPEDKTNNAKLKIFIHTGNFQQLASQMAIRGFNNDFIFIAQEGLSFDLEGNITQKEGLRIQFSTKENIENALYDATNTNPKNGWVNAKPTLIDPALRLLQVQIVADNTKGYVYETEANSGRQYVYKVNVDQIKSKIDVNYEWFKPDENGKGGLNINGTSQLININDLQTSEQAILNRIDQALRDKVVIEYQIENLAINQWPESFKPTFSPDRLEEDKTWWTKEQLNDFLDKYSKDYRASSLGIAKFNGLGVNEGWQLKARFASNDKAFSPFDPSQTANTHLGDKVDTSKVITKIDLSQYVQTLKNEETKVKYNAQNGTVSEIEPPKASGNLGEGFLSGHSFSSIQQGLSKIGVAIQFQSPGSEITQNNWIDDLTQLTKLNTHNEIFVRFRVINNNWKDTFKINAYGSENDYEQNEIKDNITKLVVNIPITINVDPTKDFQKLKDLGIEGTTINLTNFDAIKAKEEEIIKEIKTRNSSPTTNIDEAPLRILYSIKGQVFEHNNTQKQWMTIDEIQTFLGEYKQNIATNEIWAKFDLDQSNPTLAKKYTLTNAAKEKEIIQAEDESQNAKLKMYIHKNQTLIDQAKAFSATNSNEDWQIEGFEEWMKTLPKGLTIQYSKAQDPNGTWYDWVSSNREPLDVQPSLYIRFKAQDAYVYQDAIANQSYSEAYQVDTTKLKISLKLKTEWLEKVAINGNTKNIEIDETLAFNEINGANQNPDQVIQLLYSIDGINWFNKDQFKQELDKLDGAKDENNFIIRREEIKVRFSVNKEKDPNNKYSLNINGVGLTEENQKDYDVQLVDDSKNRNTNFEGYINANKFTSFIADNFSITGTSTKPKFYYKNKEQLDAFVSPYASDNIFALAFAIAPGQNNLPDYSNPNYRIWQNGMWLDEDGLIQKGVTLNGEKYFNIGLVTTNNKYKVYRDNQEEQNGYSIDISKNVQIIVEIENPFTKMQKELALIFRDENGNAKFYNGQGGFKVVTKDKNSQNIDKQLSAQDFLANSSLVQNEKDALEFVYTINDSQWSDEEWQQISSFEQINDYSSESKWKSLPTLDADKFISSLNLKVNQYISIALRVKEEFRPQGDKGFILQNNDHSVIHIQNGRVNGYKIKTSLLNVDWQNMRLINTLQESQDPLDGFSQISQINLIKTNENQDYYPNVDLKLNLFNSFWKSKPTDDEPIVARGNVKLVKRNSQGATQKGTYKNESGEDILDEQGNPIPIWVDQNNLPTSPEESNNVTKSKMLVENGDSFKFESDNNKEESLFSLFKNQKIQIEFKAKVGQGTEQVPDFYLDNDTPTRDYVLTKEIKFPIEYKNITYEFDTSILNEIKYENAQNPNLNPINGQSKIISNLKVIRSEGNNNQTFEGQTNLDKMLQNDFDGQLEFRITHIKEDGSIPVIYKTSDLSQIQNLKNNDKLMIQIVSSNPDLVFAQAPNPLYITIKGLLEKSPEEKDMQYLRVMQNGITNKKGSFKILVNNPEDGEQNEQTLLSGYKFLIRVWNKDKQIKHNWVENGFVNDLENGDKVEWKIVTDKGIDVEKPYYNTISRGTSQDANSNINYHFAQVSYKGNNVLNIFQDNTIGQLPQDNNTYPENSGFIIDGLLNEEVFDISEQGLAKVITTLNPYYEGVNGQGALRFRNIIERASVDKDGNIIQNDKQLKLVDQTQILNHQTKEVESVLLASFIEQVEFYVGNSVGEPLSNSFKYSSNDTNINNELSNGDKIYAKYNGHKHELNEVSGLSSVSDSLNPLWYILIGLGSIASLGILAIIFLAFKNKKLKIK